MAQDFVSSDGATIHYEAVGQGPALVFVHAGVADHRMWDTQVAAFASAYRVVRYDTRGFGQTTSPDGPFSNRRDLIAVMDHCHIDQAVLIGLSRGGSIVLDTALEYPDRVRGVVVVAGGVSGYDAGGNPEEDQLFAAADALEQARDWEKLADSMAHLWCDGPLQPEGRCPQAVREYVRATVLATYQQHREVLQTEPLTPPACERLADLAVPLLVMNGTYDETFTQRSMAWLAEQVPGTRKHDYPTGHMVNMEVPGAFNADLVTFLATIPW